MNGQLFLDYMDIVLRSDKVQTGPATLSDAIKNDYEAWELGEIAAQRFAKDTLLLRKEGSITSVDGQRDYNLPPDFIRCSMKARDNRTDVLLYTQSGETQGEKIWRENQNEFFGLDTDEEEEIPSAFDIIEYPLAPAEVTGTTTSAGVESNGEAILTDALRLFTTTERVYARHRIRNTVSGKPYHGIILDVTDATHLKTAMFQKGAVQSWGSGDTYAIQVASQFKLRFKYKLATSGDTITVPYYCFPPPVFSPIGMWGFPDQDNVMALAVYAVWWLKFRNVQQQQGGEVNVAALTSDRLYLVYKDFVDSALSLKTKRMFTAKPSSLLEVM